MEQIDRMNIVFTTQTVGLKVFYHLLRRIKEPLGVDKVGFYVAHSMYYDKFAKEHPEIESDNAVVKEWEIVAKARKLKPNLDKIRAYEKSVGNPTLWEPIICDRRVYLGKHCKERQDYHPSFTHEQMLSILQVVFEELERLIDEVKPDVVLSLDPVTFGDYTLYLLCKAKNIPMLFFRTTKIGNYVEFSSSMFGCSPHIYRLFQEYEKGSLTDEWIDEASAYLKSTRKAHIRYEGMILTPSKRKKAKSKGNVVGSIIKDLRDEVKYLVKYRKDHHIPGRFTPFVYSKCISPFKAKLRNWQYSRHYVSPDQLGSMDFAFYPLQSEPEISTLIWGKPYMNHIETIRNIARSLPVGMKLLVKEHPRSLGYRTSGYYRKLLEIPNVVLSNPDGDVRSLIEKSKIVVCVSTFVAFEAVLYKRPSIMLGGPRSFCILPDSMIRYVHSLNDLAVEIADLIENYEYKENSLINYIAATMRGAIPIDFFTALLKKKQRYGDIGVDKFDEQIERMAGYTVSRINSIFHDSKEFFV